MLKGILPVISPELLYTLARMGHGDEIVLADAHFPGYRVNSRVIDASGAKIPDLLRGILPLLELDINYGDCSPLIMMRAEKGDQLDPQVELSYREAMGETAEKVGCIARLERLAFYRRAAEAFAVVMSGDEAAYGNIILRKGVILA